MEHLCEIVLSCRIAKVEIRGKTMVSVKECLSGTKGSALGDRAQSLAPRLSHAATTLFLDTTNRGSGDVPRLGSIPSSPWDPPDFEGKHFTTPCEVELDVRIAEPLPVRPLFRMGRGTKTDRLPPG